MSIVHFVDTSIMVNLLNVPGKNQDHESVNRAYQRMKDQGDVFVLPVATLIETGNHIANSGGADRFRIASDFVRFIRYALTGNGNWHVRPSISQTTLETILEKVPSNASAGTGFGDISIIEQFEEYWQKEQPIGEMRIWSIDHHLSAYPVHYGGLKRRRER